MANEKMLRELADLDNQWAAKKLKQLKELLTIEQIAVLATLYMAEEHGGERCGISTDRVEVVLDELEELGFSKNTGEVR